MALQNRPGSSELWKGERAREEALKGSGQKPQGTKYIVFNVTQDPGGTHPTRMLLPASIPSVPLAVADSISSILHSLLLYTFLIFRIPLSRNISTPTPFHHSQSHLCHNFLIRNWMSVSFIWGLKCAVNNVTSLWGYVWLPSQTVIQESKGHFSVLFLHPLYF